MSEFLAPSPADARKAVEAIRERLATDPKARAKFSEDPRGFLGDRGFNRDLQRELLKENGASVAADCEYTCVATSSVCCETV